MNLIWRSWLTSTQMMPRNLYWGARSKGDDAQLQSDYSSPIGTISGQVADEACTKSRKKNWVLAEAAGFNGGIWIL